MQQKLLNNSNNKIYIQSTLKSSKKNNLTVPSNIESKSEENNFAFPTNMERKSKATQLGYESFDYFFKEFSVEIHDFHNKLNKISASGLFNCFGGSNTKLEEDRNKILSVLQHLRNKPKKNVSEISALLRAVEIFKSILSNYKDHKKIKPFIPKDLIKWINYLKNWIEINKKDEFLTQQCQLYAAQVSKEVYKNPNYIQKIATQNLQLSQQNSKLSQKHSELSEQNNKIYSILIKMQNKMCSMDTKFCTMQNEINALTNQNNEMDKKINRLNKTINTLERKNKNLLKTVNDLHSDLNEKDKVNKALTDRNQELEHKLEQVMKNKLELTKKNQRSMDVTQQLMTENKLLKIKLEKINTKFRRFKNDNTVSNNKSTGKNQYSLFYNDDCSYVPVQLERTTLYGTPKRF